MKEEEPDPSGWGTPARRERQVNRHSPRRDSCIQPWGCVVTWKCAPSLTEHPLLGEVGNLALYGKSPHLGEPIHLKKKKYGQNSPFLSASAGYEVCKHKSRAAGLEEIIKTSPESGGLTQGLPRCCNPLKKLQCRESVNLRDRNGHTAHHVYRACVCDLSAGRTHSLVSARTPCHLSTQTIFYSWHLPSATNPLPETQHPQRLASLVLICLVATADLR